MLSCLYINIHYRSSAYKSTIKPAQTTPASAIAFPPTLTAAPVYAAGHDCVALETPPTGVLLDFDGGTVTVRTGSVGEEELVGGTVTVRTGSVDELVETAAESGAEARLEDHGDELR